MGKFVSTEARDELAKRLAEISHAMIRARDQGYDGRYYPSDTEIEDIWAAAAIVSEAEVKDGAHG